MKKSHIQKFRFNKTRIFISCIIFTGLSTYLVWDYFGPREIIVKPDVIMGMSLFRVEDEELIVQEHDKEGSL